MKYFIILAFLGFSNGVTAQDFIQINGNKIHYEKKGKHGPTVILVPGYGGILSDFDPVFDSLTKLTTVIRYSRAGLGKSTYETNNKSFENIVEELESLIETLKVPQPFILVGHSFGGLIIRAFAKRHPEKVCGLLFDDSTFEDYFEILKPIEVNAEEIELKAHSSYNQNKPTDDEFKVLWDIWHSPTSWEKLFEPMPSIPTVVLTSMKVSKSSLRTSKQLMNARYLAHSRWTKNKPFSMQIGLTNSGHYIQEDTPSIFIESVRMLLNVIRDEK